MSKPESGPPVPGPESPAAAGAGTDADPAAPAAEAVEATAAETVAEDPAAGQDPRVDFRKHTAAPDAVTPAVTPDDTAEPAEPEAPADPWAAPDVTAGPLASPAPRAVPPSAAPPQPPYPLPAGGWASVTPAERSGLQPGHPYAAAPGQAPAVPGFAPGFVPGPAPTNGFAVGSLVTGLLLVAPVALVFGILALVQINRRKEGGSGMAVTGLVLGTIGTVLLALLLGAADFGSARAGRFGQAQKPPGSVHWSDLKTGDCYDSPGGVPAPGGDGDETVSWVHRVPCAEPHNGEVAGTVEIPGGDGPYPGESEARESAARLCRKVLDEYALDQWALPDGMDDVYLYPTAQNWKSGERYVTCGFEDYEDRHRGTVRTDRNSLTAPQLAYLEAVRGFNDVYLDQPGRDVSVAGPEYRAWARRMAVASRTEAAVLGNPGAPWPADVRPGIVKLVDAQSQAAAAWDAAASGDDVAGDVRRARALVAKTAPITLEIRRGLSLSTGEQAPDLRV
ncbi:DUF4190 domain-containing protein [Kitasatospora sp. NPDC091335]|uniref:DUF4190 domain-containing protein n=1 Tax=Kitasatospora sp. NPDC091335 TaxID=3364085 RepID=UPI0038105F76